MACKAGRSGSTFPLQPQRVRNRLIDSLDVQHWTNIDPLDINLSEIFRRPVFAGLFI